MPSEDTSDRAIDALIRLAHALDQNTKTVEASMRVQQKLVAQLIALTTRVGGQSLVKTALEGLLGSRR
jgi:hypothetical protein